MTPPYWKDAPYTKFFGEAVEITDLVEECKNADTTMYAKPYGLINPNVRAELCGEQAWYTDSPYYFGTGEEQPSLEAACATDKPIYDKPSGFGMDQRATACVGVGTTTYYKNSTCSATSDTTGTPIEDLEAHCKGGYPIYVYASTCAANALSDVRESVCATLDGETMAEAETSASGA
jgi:hypothetical protein